MRTRVKFCGLVRPEDVDVAVALGVDAIGFVFYPRSPRYLPPDEAARLRRRLPSWVSAVGLFVNESLGHCQTVARTVGLDVIQAHGDETPEQLQGLGLPYWKALRIGVPPDQAAPQQGRVLAGAGAVQAAMALFGGAECCLLDSASQGYGGSGQTFDWSVLPAPSGASGRPAQGAPIAGPGARVVLAGGLGPDTVGEAIRRVAPFAVDVSSGIQANSPREKDVVRMEGFVAAVWQADRDRRAARAARPERNR